MRVVVETPCQHGKMECWGCPGGSRRVLTPGEFVLVEKVDGEWPEPLRERLRTAWANASETHPTDVPWHGYIDAILDALAVGEGS